MRFPSKKSNIRPADILLWGSVGLFILLGLLLLFALVGYEFSALICFGIAALIVCYWLLSLLGKRHQKTANILRILLSVCLGLGLIAAAVTGRVIAKASLGSPDSNCRYIIVLGAGVNGTVPSLSLQDRLDATYAYLASHPDTICVVSGCQGDGEDISEAQCMYNDLTARGIAPERIWMEERATNTRENLRFSLDLIEERTGTRPTEVGLVSSEYHLYRAGLFAREQNVTACTIPAKTSWVSLRINYFLREIAAVWYYSILGG